MKNSIAKSFFAQPVPRHPAGLIVGTVSLLVMASLAGTGAFAVPVDEAIARIERGEAPVLPRELSEEEFLARVATRAITTPGNDWLDRFVVARRIQTTNILRFIEPNPRQFAEVQKRLTAVDYATIILTGDFQWSDSLPDQAGEVRNHLRDEVIFNRGESSRIPVDVARGVVAELARHIQMTGERARLGTNNLLKLLNDYLEDGHRRALWGPGQLDEALVVSMFHRLSARTNAWTRWLDRRVEATSAAEVENALALFATVYPALDDPARAIQALIERLVQRYGDALRPGDPSSESGNRLAASLLVVGVLSDRYAGENGADDAGYAAMAKLAAQAGRELTSSMGQGYHPHRW